MRILRSRLARRTRPGLAATLVATQLPWLDRLPGPPDLVTCSIGANDVIRPWGFERVPELLRSVVAQLPEGAVIADPNDAGYADWCAAFAVAIGLPGA